MSPTRRYVDRGGTFTDVVTWTPGAPPTIHKLPSDQAVLGELGQGALVFGTTVATNALLEHAHVRAALITHDGLTDLPWLRTMARPSLFDPDARWPAPLVDRVIGVGGRLDVTGAEIEPLTLPADLAAQLDGLEAVAIALLHSPRNPAHERAVGAAVLALRPDLHVVYGHEVCPDVGLLARLETATVDAAVTPVLRRALLRDRLPAGARAIRSDGTLVDADALRAPDAVLSGPAGGVLAVAAIAARVGAPGAIGFDMGGTSTDVCVVVGDTLPRRSEDTWVAGHAVRRPSLEVATIAAGGGSVLWSDGQRLRVGPRSGGANPGPQAYGRGGPPTVTDAALAVGLLDPNAFSPPLDPSCVDLPGDAAAFLDVAREEMARAIRALASSRGVDVRTLPLVAFGGAAGQHAAFVAERLGVDVVLVHPFASALSAWGQTLARPTTERLRSVWRTWSDASVDVPRMIDTLSHDLAVDDELTATLSLRAAGTDFALDVPWTGDATDAPRAFDDAHRALFGFTRPGVLELVSVRVTARGAADDVPWPDDDPWSLGDARREGPCRVDCPTTSVVVPEGWIARRANGLLRVERVARASQVPDTTRTPHGLALWASRFMAVAEESGERLARLARSVSIRERRDFSCAVFDGDGALVANAPHVPVHLGAMGETVRDLIANEPALPHGSAWLTNDPQAGGSHLPDLTVVTVVQHQGQRFFVACRAHHADVGGLTPGSMPPASTRLADEGIVFRRRCLFDGARALPIDDAIGASRRPDWLIADLDAQIAANKLASESLVALGSADLIAAWMRHLHDAADEAVRARLPSLPALGEARDSLDGVPLCVRSTRGDRLTLDFTGTGGPHPGNLNAPRAVTRAAVLYALRVLLADDVPLVEGALRSVEIVLPSPSVLSPPPDAAVVGGNVETSQRLVDLLLRAWGLRASGQGTMNNLTLGGDGWTFYETIGGGQGASAAHDGVSGLQVHMTNTRATDVEVLENRLPVRVRRFAIRRGSGGLGARRGGHGVMRELEVLADCTASLLATRRTDGAPGLNGGGDGWPGLDAVIRGGEAKPWDGAAIRLKTGDRVVIETPGGGGYGSPLTQSDTQAPAPVVIPRP